MFAKKYDVLLKYIEYPIGEAESVEKTGNILDFSVLNMIIIIMNRS